MKKFAVLFLFILIISSALAQDSKFVDETVIGETYYDLQTWRSMQNRIYHFNDGTIGTVWNMGFNYPQFPDMGIGYNYFDGNNWSDWPFQSITSQWATNPSYAPFGENGEIVVCQGQNGLIITYRENKGTGEWQESYFSGTGLIHPLIVTTGINHSTIHILYLQQDDFTPTEPQPFRGFLHYARSTDGGTTWNNQQFPCLGPDLYLGFTIGAYVWAEPKDNVLAFLAGDYLTDLVLMKSIDGGNTWQKTVIWEHPYPFFEIFSFNSEPFYCNDGAVTIALDNNNIAHIAFGLSRVFSSTVQDTIWYYPNIGGIAYWREGMPTFPNGMNSLHPDTLMASGNLIGWLQDSNNNGIFDTIDYVTYPTTSGMSTMPQFSIDYSNNILLVFSSVTETYGNGTYNYRHLWARTSIDEGITWGDFTDLNTELIHIFDECNYPAVSSISDDRWHLIYNTDDYPGLSVLGDDPYFTENRIYYMNFEKGGNSIWLNVNFSANTTTVHEDDTIFFINLCDGNPFPTSFEWVFGGGIPASSNEFEPYVVYETQGVYDVSLNADNG
ncbi:MAG: hypothetical protein K8R58_10245, partial [Bacteroidales bacterium]|nr:hypothetical protein [Bacteroidales bacterium]